VPKGNTDVRVKILSLRHPMTFAPAVAGSINQSLLMLESEHQVLRGFRHLSLHLLHELPHGGDMAG
jgi:hypothetical protein